MIYKMYDTPGDWQVAETGKPCMILEVDANESTESQEMGWTEFSSIEAAAEAWGLVPYIRTENT